MDKVWPQIEAEVSTLVDQIPEAVRDGQYGVAARLCHEYLGLYMALLDIVLVDYIRKNQR